MPGMIALPGVERRDIAWLMTCSPVVPSGTYIGAGMHRRGTQGVIGKCCVMIALPGVERQVVAELMTCSPAVPSAI